MRKLKIACGLAALVAVVAACDVFDDKTPEFITLRMTGPAGDTVSFLYSKEFVAGVTETGVTQVRLFAADTVRHVLPVDTVIDVREEQRIYIEAQAVDTLDVDVRVEVDDRSLYDDQGKLFPSFPWQFLYQFNQRYTNNIEVVI